MMSSITTRTVGIFKKSTDYIREGLFSGRPLFAYVGGFLRQQNLGDESLYEAARILFDKVAFVHFDGSRTLRFLNKHLLLTKAGLLAGGTLINRTPEWYHLFDDFVKLCPNLFVFGTGVAHPSFWAGRRDFVDIMGKWKNLLNQCQYVGVRGPISADILREAGVVKVEVVGDPVLTFAGESVNPHYIPNSLGLNIGEASDKMWGDQQTLCDEYVKLAIRARVTGWKVEWFVVWPSDLALTRHIACQSGTDQHIHIVYDNPRTYLDLVKRMSVFVGMKLHATVLALCEYVPSVMIEYRPKCSDFMQSIGKQAWTLKANELISEAVWDIITHWDSDRNRIAGELYDVIYGMKIYQKSKAEEVMDKLLKTTW